MKYDAKNSLLPEKGHKQKNNRINLKPPGKHTECKHPFSCCRKMSIVVSWAGISQRRPHICHRGNDRAGRCNDVYAKGRHEQRCDNANEHEEKQETPDSPKRFLGHIFFVQFESCLCTRMNELVHLPIGLFEHKHDPHLFHSAAGRTYHSAIEHEA